MPAESIQPPSSPHEACTVQERIAIGTAGVVYRGLHASTGREVTFKVLSPASTHPMEPARVLALRWRLEALQHPVIAALLDAYEDPEGFVVITSWLGGGVGGNDYPEKVRNLNKQEARLLAMRLCSALLVGEQQHFPHGDIKPSNVILADRGPQGLEVQIQDWGLSACREEQPSETLQFMAPERHHGHPPSVQGDLFSAGATLWFLLTGETPSYGSTRDEVLESWGLFDAATLAEKRPDLDEHFRQWVAWLLRWQPGDRPGSVSQALDVLTEVLTYAAALEAQVKSQAVAAVASASVPQAPVAASPAAASAASEITRPTAARPAAPSASRPGAPRAASPRLTLPVASPAPPPTADPAGQAKVKARDPASKPQINKGQRVMGAVMALCIVAGIAIAFVAWAEDRYGHDWQHQMAEHWRGIFRGEPALETASAAPAKPTPKLAAAAKGPPAAAKPASAAVAKPAATPPAPKPNAPKPFAAERFDGTGDLQGSKGGWGWKGVWQASQVSLDNRKAIFGKGADSAASRLVRPLKELGDDYLTVSAMVTHPGEGGPMLKLDVLSADGKTLVAPACVGFEDGKVRVFIEGAKEKLEAPAGKPFRLVVRWNWKTKKAAGKRDIVVVAHVDPPNDPEKAKTAPASMHELADQTLPTNLFVAIQCNSAAQPVTVGEIRIGRYLRDALP